MSAIGTQPARLAAVLVLALAPAVVGGCMRTTAVTAEDAGAAEGAHQKPWAHFFWYGTVGEKDVDVRRLCSGPVARVQTYDDLLTLFLSFASLGIYTPRRVDVTCVGSAGPGPGRT